LLEGKDYTVDSGAVVSSILDMRRGKLTLHFVVDGELLPHAIVNISYNEKMHIGVYIIILFIYLIIYIIIYLPVTIYIYIIIYLSLFIYLKYVVFLLFQSHRNPYSRISPLTPSTSSKHQMHCI
jgi:hypothetical protein